MKTQKIQIGITFMMVLSLSFFMGMWAPHSARAEESRLYVGGSMPMRHPQERAGAMTRLPMSSP